MPGAVVHALRPGVTANVGPAAGRSRLARAASLIPVDALRIINALRYLGAGVRKTVDDIGPDVLQAHFVVEHGFYGSFVGFHPYVVSAWGSDLFVAPRSLAGRVIARRALGSADLVTANDPELARIAASLGVKPDRLRVVRLGIDDGFLSGDIESVNLGHEEGEPLVVLSDRALQPLYNVDVVLQAFARLDHEMPEARLVVANDGSERRVLEALATGLGIEDRVAFVGKLTGQELRKALAAAAVYVSVPDSDSLSLSTMEAMAAGAFPVVSDLASQDGWITDGENGLRVPANDVDALAGALRRALTDSELRRSAVGPNRRKVEADGRREQQMLGLEKEFYRLAGCQVTNEA